MNARKILGAHREIQNANARNLREWKNRKAVIKMHAEFVRSGMLDEAYLLMRLLRNGTVRLGLYDSASNVELALERIGYKPWYTRNFNVAEFSLKRLID